MNELKIKEIKNMIYLIRGREVMLDSDLAKLYECKNGTKAINLAVKRHINRFPERYMFQLTKEEASRFQNETLNKDNNKRGLNIKYLPYAFTEQGVAMLATIIKTSVAEQVSIAIMDAFVAMRHFINDNKDIYISLNSINNKLIEHDLMFEKIFAKFGKENNELLFLNGEVYNAYSKTNRHYE